MTAEGSDAPKSKRPPSNAFYQQKLRAWQPILTPRWVIITFLTVGVTFIAIGIPLYLASAGVVEYKVQYAGSRRSTCVSPYCSYQKVDTNTLPDHSEIVTLSVADGEEMKEMKGPVFVYYELTNFYQNHRRYVKSRSDGQLRGDDVSDSSLSTCEPLREIKRNGTSYKAVPCGLIANSMFNDTFSFTTSNATVMDETNIAWNSDKERKYKNAGGYDSNPSGYSPENTNSLYLKNLYPMLEMSEEKGGVGVKNEHFIVWMRTAALPNFRKLYGRIDAGIPAGTRNFEIDVVSRFPVDSFKGTKTVVLSTTSWLGGKNPFLGYAYFTVGGICIVLGVLFFVKNIFCPRKLGDPSHMNFDRKSRCGGC
jgi:hypothetical protein